MKKVPQIIKTLGLLIIFLTSKLLNAQQIKNLNAGYIEPKNYHTTFDFEEIDNKIIIQVIVNNKNKRFILDTGAPTSFSEALLSEINYKSIAKDTVSDISGKKDVIAIIQIPEFLISGLSFKNQYALKLTDMTIFECYNVNGILGSNSLRNSVVEFDHNNKKLTISSRFKNFKYQNLLANKLYFFDQQSRPFLKINPKIGNVTLKNEVILFDSGDSEFYSINSVVRDSLISNADEFYLHSNPYNTTKEDIIGLIANSEGTIEIGLFGAADINLHSQLNVTELPFGNVKFTNLITETTGSKPSRIGYEVLKHGKLIIDYKKAKYYYEPYTNQKFIEIDDKADRLNLSFVNNKLIIGIIWDKSLRDQLKVGDEVLSVNDYNFEGLLFCESFDLAKKIETLETDKRLLKLRDVETSEIKILEIDGF